MEKVNLTKEHYIQTKLAQYKLDKLKQEETNCTFGVKEVLHWCNDSINRVFCRV